ncbi:hypothetical protein ACQKP7_02200 [Pseudomonas frederiksbergensis]|uniref:hypothetical protein n=1 Tax=Pseudomonas frederiksbergensis TaxID=104087 RepID=UPI003D0778CB
MVRERKAGGDKGSMNAQTASPENGFYYIEDQTGDDEIDFDWFPRDQTADPPTGQYLLSEAALATYFWCEDHIKDEKKYRATIGRLRKIVFGGLVDIPIARDAPKRLTELNAELIAWANNQLRPHFIKSIWLRLIAMTVFFVAGLICSTMALPALSMLGNWLLFIATASGATAALLWHRMPIHELVAYPMAMIKATHHEIDFIVSLVLVLGTAFIIQNKWITLQLGGTSLEITASTPGALAIGFVLGLLSDRMMQLISPLLERVSRGFISTPTKKLESTKKA